MEGVPGCMPATEREQPTLALLYFFVHSRLNFIVVIIGGRSGGVVRNASLECGGMFERKDVAGGASPILYWPIHSIERDDL